MVKGIFKGSSIGKISGHRKGDISEKFDMAVCIQCHNPAHGSNTVYKEFCTRCHDPNQKASVAIGPTHLNSTKWTGFNTVGGGMALFLILGTFVYLSYKSRETFSRRIRNWHESMKVIEEKIVITETETEKKEVKEPESSDSEKETEQRVESIEDKTESDERPEPKLEDDEQ